ncbi:hypothetical protein, partial [Acinetobacter baumannii]|uniref:hypothetical protein n=1 Tax=Acinetobacter baumannii TaxID=470 RepID=UPI0033343164
SVTYHEMTIRPNVPYFLVPCFFDCFLFLLGLLSFKTTPKNPPKFAFQIPHTITFFSPSRLRFDFWISAKLMAAWRVYQQTFENY